MFKTPLSVVFLILFSLMSVIAADEPLGHAPTPAVVMASSLSSNVQAPMIEPVMATNHTTALVPLTVDEATKMGWLRMAAMIMGIIALSITFFHALARRPNSAHR